jgi:hypothetical protein
MKLKLLGNVLALALIAGTLASCNKNGAASGGSNVEAARTEQATPQATVKAMFEMFNSQFNKTFIGVQLAGGKDLQPNEEKFAGLFWDHERAGVLYTALYDRQAELQSLADADHTGASVNVAASVKAFASKEDEEKRDALYTFELRQRGPNWYVYELRGQKSPVGLYEQTKQIEKQGVTR